MRTRGRIDENQPAIVKALRKIGCGVLMLSPLRGGAPDLLVSFRSKYFLFEIKDGDKVASRKQLTPAEREWIESWPGKVSIIESLDDALAALNG